MLVYFARLRPGKMVLWCYLIWYLVTVYFRFDAKPALWLNSVGISAVIGIALVLSVRDPSQGRLEPWQMFRLFAMPFCVSSFAALIKGQGYFLVFPAQAFELACALAACGFFVATAMVLRKLVPPASIHAHSTDARFSRS